MCTHTRVTFRPESKSDLGSCETILRDRLKRESRTRLAYTVYARARTRLSACVCAGYAYSYTPAQMTERTYIRTYIPRIDPDLYCLALMRSAIYTTVTIPYIFLNVSTRFFFTVTSRHFTQCACAEFTCSTPCTVLAVYKVVQMDPEDRRRARLSRRRQRERDRRASESAEQRESRLARRRARDRARRASQSETLEDREARLIGASVSEPPPGGVNAIFALYIYIRSYVRTSSCTVTRA